MGGYGCNQRPPAALLLIRNVCNTHICYMQAKNIYIYSEFGKSAALRTWLGGINQSRGDLDEQRRIVRSLKAGLKADDRAEADLFGSGVDAGRARLKG